MDMVKYQVTFLLIGWVPNKKTSWMINWEIKSCGNHGSSTSKCHNVKVQDGMWTFEHDSLKKLLMSNVYPKNIPLAGHLYRLTMQKVPQILSKKISKSHLFPSKSDKNNTHWKEKYWFVTLELSSVKQIVINNRIRKLEIHQFYETVHVPSCTLNQ